MMFIHKKLMIPANLPLHVLLFIVFCVGSVTVSTGQTVDSNYVDGQIYVKVKQSSNVVLFPDSNNNATLTNTVYNVYDIDSMTRPFYGMNDTLDRIYRVYFANPSNVNQLITAFENIQFIQYAEQVPLYYRNHTPNDPEFGQQYHLPRIDAEQAWDSSKGSSSVVIAVVDNAVLLDHEDLADNLWTNPGETPNNGIDDDLNGYTDDIHGWDVADDDNNPSPPPNTTDTSAFVHGTATAGIAAAVTNNGKGVASIGYNLSIMALKCSPSSSDGRIITNADDGVFYAARNGADIISMSYGSSGDAITSETVINTAEDNGALLVGAAGNNNKNQVFYPAKYDAVFAVGATDANDKKAGYSNYGSDIDVMAPGSNIYSPSAGTDSSYKAFWGTSMSCPLVAGLAGLYHAENPNADASAIKTAIKDGCEEIDSLNPSYSGQLGAGRINALATLGGEPDVPTSAGPEMTTNNLSVSPNPASDRLSINLEEHSADLAIELHLFSLKGELVLQKELPLNKASAEVSLPDRIDDGLYLISVQGEDFVTNRKVVVER